MDSMEQKRQGEEGKKEKNPTKPNQTAHTFTRKGGEGVRAAAHSRLWTARALDRALRAEEMAED